MAPTEPVDNSRVTVVHNARKPALGALRFAERLRERGIDVDVVVSDDAAQADAAARRALDAGVELVVASGGDGTIRSILDAIYEAHATLGVLPLGTANDLATDLGIRTIDDAALAVIAARARAWDAGMCTYHGADGSEKRSPFCSTAGVGLVARAMAMSQRRVGSALKRVLRNGAWPPLITASTYLTRARPCVLTFDGKRVERDLMMLEISKLRAAGGIPVTPDARGDSGMLHAWTVGNPRIWEFAGILYDSLSGSMRQLESEHVEYFSREPSQNRAGVSGVTRLAIESDVPMPVHLNGDYVGVTPAVFELTPSAFRVLAPPGLAGEAVRVVPEKPRGVAAQVARA
ncbi:MAG TPA: diacylglycerol kinase family protein [Polyangiales bacterium]|nr:diacylglycerol kinase family protein [Polyangiales bacterium]